MRRARAAIAGFSLLAACGDSPTRHDGSFEAGAVPSDASDPDDADDGLEGGVEHEAGPRLDAASDANGEGGSSCAPGLEPQGDACAAGDW